MEKIKINITKAQLKGFNVEFNEEGLPDVTATLGLFTKEGKEVSTYTISTRSWNDNVMELPISMVLPIMEIAKDIELITTRHCREGQKALAAPKK